MPHHHFPLLTLPFLAGCAQMSMMSGDFGATQGGVQDMGLARELIASGYVPPPEAFVVEGMFSEHDLGLEGEACDTLLCLRAAGGAAPDGDGNAAGFVQVGMSSTIDPYNYTRDSLTLVAVVDVSGSMGWDYTEVSEEYVSPGAISRALLHAIVDELGSQDRIAIVTYGSRVRTALDFTDPTEEKVDREIDDLEEGGSTDMEGGLERAYELARDADFGTDQVRLALFTDVQPNVGATSASDFESMAEEGAEDGIGLTVFAVGVGMGQEVLNGMSHLRGGNAFSLFDLEDVDELMADSWPWMFSPIAYDLSVLVEPPAGFSLARGYGFPAGTDAAPTSELEVATVFLSRRRGAMLLQLTPDDGDVGPFVVSGTIAYTTPNGAARSADVRASFDGVLDDRGQGWEQHSVGRTAALALLVDGMKTAATEYATDQATAVASMTAVHDRFAADATALADDDLPVEVQLAADLLALMTAGAPQESSLYGY
jgi:Ca-activated chloride channel family protein